jgi:hypothetical protein
VASWLAELARWEAPRGGARFGVDGVEVPPAGEAPGRAREGDQLAGAVWAEFEAATRAKVTSWPAPLGKQAGRQRAPF